MEYSIYQRPWVQAVRTLELNKMIGMHFLKTIYFFPFTGRPVYGTTLGGQRKRSRPAHRATASPVTVPLSPRVQRAPAHPASCQLVATLSATLPTSLPDPRDRHSSLSLRHRCSSLGKLCCQGLSESPLLCLPHCRSLPPLPNSDPRWEEASHISSSFSASAECPSVQLNSDNVLGESGRSHELRAQPRELAPIPTSDASHRSRLSPVLLSNHL